MASPKRLWRERKTCSYVAVEVRPPYGSGEATVRMESLPEGDGLYVAMLEVATVVLLSEKLSPEARGEFCEALRAAALRAREGL